MRSFHFIGGLLRSGSTLTCNILNQNPRFYVSSTSPLPAQVTALQSVLSRSVEVKGLMVKDRAATLHRMERTIRATAEGWYAHVEKPVVIDKSRAWNFHAGLISQVWPDAKLITIVRDLRSIVASIEKQHANTAILDEADSFAAKTAIERAGHMFTPANPVGLSLMGMEDLIRRKPKNWLAIRYEDLCDEPHTQLNKLYDFLGEKRYRHDLTNIVNVAEDVDELYNLKFPHQGDGPLRTREDRDWEGQISEDIEKNINTFTLYSRFFDYG
jgi:sulfotransferase